MLWRFCAGDAVLDADPSPWSAKCGKYGACGRGVVGGDRESEAWDDEDGSSDEKGFAMVVSGSSNEIAPSEGGIFSSSAGRLGRGASVSESEVSLWSMSLLPDGSVGGGTSTVDGGLQGGGEAKEDDEDDEDV